MPGDKTRQDRIDLQEEDDGDLDDTVWYVRSPENKSYHEDPSCRLFSEDKEPEDTTREGAQLRWLGPCRLCVLGNQ